MLENCAHIIVSVSHGSLRLVKNVDAESKMVESLGVECNFLTPEWDDLTKAVVFIRPGLTPMAQIIPEGQNCVSVPWEILDTTEDTHKDLFYEIGVLGTGQNGIRLPTNRIRLKIDHSCCVSTQTPQQPSPDVYSQIISMINDLNNYSESEIRTFIADYCSDNHIVTKTYVDGAVSEKYGVDNPPPIATSTQSGCIKIGEGFKVVDGVLTLDTEVVQGMITMDSGLITDIN